MIRQGIFRIAIPCTLIGDFMAVSWDHKNAQWLLSHTPSGHRAHVFDNKDVAIAVAMVCQEWCKRPDVLSEDPKVAGAAWPRVLTLYMTAMRDADHVTPFNTYCSQRGFKPPFE